MKTSLLLISGCIAAAGCGSTDTKADSIDLPESQASSLLGELPSMARLACGIPADGELQTIDYEFRFYFSEGLWDSKRPFGGWSPYGSIADINEREIAVVLDSSVFTFTRADLTAAQSTDLGIAPGADVFRKCIVTEVQA